MACLYCRRGQPVLRMTDSHVFPRSFGGTLRVRQLVCGSCNGRISREVEWPARRDFSPFLSWWGIRGRSRRPPRVEGTLIFGDLQARASVDGRGDPVEIHPIEGVDATGHRQVTLLGPAGEVERRRARYERRWPQWTWRDLDLATLPPPVFEGTLPTASLISSYMRRLAAKIAFEAFARKRRRAPTIPLDQEYDGIRRFILEGVEPPQAVAGLLWHERLMTRPLRLPIPLHMVALVEHLADLVFGGFVVLFGLYYYWVILSHRHAALAPTEPILLIHPQAGTIIEPILRATPRPVRVPWRVLIAGTADQQATLRRATQFAIQKLRQLTADHAPAAQ